MSTFEKIVESFKGQDTGFIFIFFIAIAIIASLIMGGVVVKQYRRLIKALKNAEPATDRNKAAKGEKNIENQILKNIVNEFKVSAENGTENINTEVIILKNIDSKISRYEKWLKALPATCIAFGLLGTFLGLTLAIINTQDVLGGIESMAQFSEKMNGPFSSMSSAFWTSIFGVSASLLLNLFSIRVETTKDTFYDYMENYLDNIIYPLYAISDYDEFNNTIKVTMMDLTKEMRTLFEDGVKELVSSINTNTIDLTKTAEGLSNYTKDLDRLTKNLDKSVNNFKEPVDIFKSSIYEFTSVSEDLSDVMKDTMNKVTINVDKLDSNLTSLYDVVDNNKRELSSISEVLKRDSYTLNESYNKVIELVNLVANQQHINSDELKTQIMNLNKGYESFREGLYTFSESLREIEGEMSKGITQSLQKEMTSLTENIVNKLDLSIKGVESATEQLAKNSITIGEVVKATNELYVSAISKQNDEVSMNEA